MRFEFQFVFAVLCAAGLSAQTIPAELRASLQTSLHVTEAQIERVERGGVLASTVHTGVADEVMLVGVVRIWATPRYFTEQFKNVVQFEAAPGVTNGLFGTPPQLGDLSGLMLSAKDVEELRTCRPGKCAFKAGDTGIRLLHDKVDWSARNYADQAAAAFREIWLEYLLRYQAQGNEGLAVYHDTASYYHVERGLADLMARTAGLQVGTPRMAEYLRDYPNAKDASTEEFFYWQVGSFGLKPVHRVTHVAIQQMPGPLGDAYIIASKMLLASHYFKSALELRYLIPGQDQQIGGMHYLVVVQRSHVDGLTGFKGSIMKKVVTSKSRQAMEKYLLGVKQKVEAGFNRPR